MIGQLARATPKNKVGDDEKNNRADEDVLHGVALDCAAGESGRGANPLHLARSILYRGARLPICHLIDRPKQGPSRLPRQGP